MNNRGVGLNYGLHSPNPYLGYLQPEMMIQNTYTDWYELRNMVEPNLNEIDTFTSISFDSHDEIIWGGLRSGRVISYLSPSLHKYVSIEAHKSQVKQLLPFENGIISLSSELLRIHSKGGVSRCEFYDYNQVVTKFNCAAFTSKTKDEFILAGEGDQALLFDVETAQPKSYIITNSSNMNNICKVASSRTVCFGNVDGRVGIYDPRTYREVQSFAAHTGGLYDLDIKGDFLVTCGFSSLRYVKHFRIAEFNHNHH
jgi:PAB-dependent poly(A)-specific ribonuclease subunit 2